MAEIQDLDNSEIGEIEAVEAQAEQVAEVPQQQEPELPSKYRGKTAAEIAKMHEEAEKLIARQGQEVGEIRKLADELIKSQLVKKPEAVEQPKEIDFFENPQEAIRRAVEANPKVLAAEQYAVQAQRVLAQQALLQKHPDMLQIAQDPEFQQWVGKSKVRQELFKRADAYDADSADELLSTFKELRGTKTVKQETVQVDKVARDATLKTAAVDVGGSGETGKKVYRRADLINLRIHNPAKYEAMQDEISAAYREGRVK